MRLILIWCTKDEYSLDIPRPKNSFTSCLNVILVSRGLDLAFPWFCFKKKYLKLCRRYLNSLNARMDCGCEGERIGITVLGHEENMKV